MIQEVVNFMTTILLAKFVLNDIPHASGMYSPSSPSSSYTSEIISRAGLEEYEYRWFPMPEEPSKPREYPYTRTKTIGPYQIKMTRTGGTGTIKLYEFLEGWKKKLRATWTGMEKAECERKFEEVAEVIRQVRFEQKVGLRR